MFFPEHNVHKTMTLTQSQIYEGNAFRAFHYFDVPAEGDESIDPEDIKILPNDTEFLLRTPIQIWKFQKLLFI